MEWTMIAFQQSAVCGRSIPAPADIVGRMAEKMRELGMNGTAVTADTLFEHSDFTRDEIERHGRDAADLARARAVRRVA
jgi:hypothetical protein